MGTSQALSESCSPNPVEDISTKVWKGQRIALADLLRGLAAVCIVWHHLSLYSPQSDLADKFSPAIGYSLWNHALYAVAVFFVLSGLTSSIQKRASQSSLLDFLSGIVDRYLRLAIPYLVMLALLIGFEALSRRFGWELRLFDSFSWNQLAAHLFFLQDLLGYGNLSAGTWYLCIEMQWFCFITILYALTRNNQSSFTTRSIACIVLFPLGVLSAWHWSRQKEFEAIFLFFVSQYVLGIFLGWTLQKKIPGWLLPVYGSILAASLIVNPRTQLLVSLIVTALLWFGYSRTSTWELSSPWRWLSNISYSLFLIHYLVNGIVLRALNPWAEQGPARAFCSMGIAFLCSVGAAHLFYRYVELPTQGWLKRRKESQVARPA